MSNDRERKDPDKSQVQNSLLARRLQAIKAGDDRRLESRRNKLYDLFQRENSKLMTAYCDMLRKKETARKVSIINEVVKIQELIKVKNAEIANRERARSLNRYNEEYRLCKPKILNKMIKRDQEAIIESRRRQKAYDKAREFKLLLQGDGFSLQFSKAEENRKKDRTINNKHHQDYLLQQMTETEKKKRVEDRKLEDFKDMEEITRSETEAQTQEMLKNMEKKRQLRKDLETQIEEVKKKIKQDEKANTAIDKLLQQNWMPFSSVDDNRKQAEDLNHQARLFMLHQQQVRDQKRRAQLEADKKLSEINERSHLQHMRREKAYQCYLQNLKKETLEAHRLAVVEREINQPVLKAQRIEQEAKELDEVQRRDKEKEKELEANKVSKRMDLRTNLEQQLEELRLRREAEAREKRMGEESARRANEDYQRRMKNLHCEDLNWREYNLHPWREAAMKKIHN
ncbi:hypothetical protein Aperf_G00000019909 [Anoplocephala perfoliata]